MIGVIYYLTKNRCEPAATKFTPTRYSVDYLMKVNLMYIYDHINVRAMSESRSQHNEQLITPQPAQRNSYCPDRVVSGFVGA